MKTAQIRRLPSNNGGDDGKGFELQFIATSIDQIGNQKRHQLDPFPNCGITELGSWLICQNGRRSNSISRYLVAVRGGNSGSIKCCLWREYSNVGSTHYSLLFLPLPPRDFAPIPISLQHQGGFNFDRVHRHIVVGSISSISGGRLAAAAAAVLQSLQSSFPRRGDPELLEERSNKSRSRQNSPGIVPRGF
jgi:hypothetical protein